ncbi:putative ABC transporter lipoprotein [Pseudomonas cichorii]|uniref:Putative ABC transporter lipoprotein n=1 Tax=Pseudomonas cichorii TaxID=36746 RepID=A0A3M4LPD3_PSECI|nr:HlyD family secretion protein [Pseudomonas cichorii]RMQ43250.1 putative ABC transporter lipoprotein [Pseudomonas cichorii]
MSMTSRQTLTLCGVALVLAGLGLYSLMDSSDRQSTNDAFIAADYSVVAPKVSGFISQVLVEDNQVVKAGQLLAQIDDRDLQTALASAEAGVLTAAAQLEQATAVLQRQTSVIAQARAALVASSAAVKFAEQERTRYEHLAGAGAGTVQNAQQARNRIDTANAQHASATASVVAERKQVDILTALQHSAEAGLQRAQAARDQARLQLSYTRIVAPVDGTVGERALRVGNYVNPGSKLLSIVPLEHAYVLGNFQETQLTHVTVGQAVEVRIDTYPGEVLKAHVQSIAPATGVTFAAIRPDNATGNFTKVVQRIPVKIVLDPQQPLLGHLRVGMSVEASIDTRSVESEPQVSAL